MRSYITKRELADTLGVSLSTINNKLNDLPRYKFGKARNSRVLFPLAKLKKLFPDIDYKNKEGLS
jgi:hypothetical protein